MRKFIIERELPGIGESTRNELRAAALKSNSALAERSGFPATVITEVVTTFDPSTAAELREADVPV